MGSVYRRRAKRHEVGLEVRVIDGEVVANIRPPNGHEPTFDVERMPLVEAAIVATRLAERFGVDIAVIDLDAPDK